MELHGREVTLRPTTPADAPALLAILGDHRVTATSCTAFACYSDTKTYTIDAPPPPTPTTRLPSSIS